MRRSKEERQDTDSTLRQIKKERTGSQRRAKRVGNREEKHIQRAGRSKAGTTEPVAGGNCGKFVSVQILADLLEIRDERWHNAVEGYMGNNKLLLIVEPKYAKAAMDIYQEMDKKKFFRAAILDTEKVMEEEHIVRQGALAEEVKAKRKIRAVLHQFLSW